MRELVCQPFCSFYKPDKVEAEKCLAGVLLAAWQRRQPAQPLPDLQAQPPAPALLAEVAGQFCGKCVFRKHGCDFATGTPAAEPCGGLRAWAGLVQAGVLAVTDLPKIWQELLPALYLRLADHVFLKYLETPNLYDRLADELYEVNDVAFLWLSRCDGRTPGLAARAEPAFLDYLLQESLLAVCLEPTPRQLRWRPSPLPSLRYLELLLTERCNLRCRHCYLGEAGTQELPLELVLQTLTEFADLQGLRVLLSGGEPLLYRQWPALNARLPDFELRFVLLTNGLLLTDEVIRTLKVPEVQLSIDGLQAGHDWLRGPGTWERTASRIPALQAAGIQVSVATMIHRHNLTELPEMRDWLLQQGVREWNLDLPCVAGRATPEAEWLVTPEEAAPLLDLGFGGAAHGAGEGYACGYHLAAVLPNGTVAKCALYGDEPLGRLEEGLETCWLRLRHLRLTELACAPCEYLHDCHGGCRFRAGRGLGPDPVMCARYGVSQPGQPHEVVSKHSGDFAPAGREPRPAAFRGRQ